MSKLLDRYWWILLIAIMLGGLSAAIISEEKLANRIYTLYDIDRDKVVETEHYGGNKVYHVQYIDNGELIDLYVDPKTGEKIR